MKAIIKYSLSFLCCSMLLFWGCQKVMEVELPAHEAKLVLNAVFNTDSLFTVHVSASQSAFSNEAHRPIENATVSLFQSEKHLLDLHYLGDGTYQADQKPEPGQYYALKVQAPTYPGASAAIYMPEEPLLYNIQASRGPVHYDWQGATVNASFTLADAAEEENFYYLRVFTPDTSYDGIPFNKYVRIISSSPIETEFSMETRFFFSDKLFNGKALALKLNVENSPDNTTYIQVAHITKEYFQYVRTLDKQSYNDSFNLTPIPVTNNINNGHGLFGGSTVQTLMIKP